MGLLKVQDLKPGMVLEEDLRSSNGRLLLQQGARIEERHLRTCKIWGIAEARVRGVSAEEVETRRLSGLNPEILKQARLMCVAAFAANDLRDPVVRELARLFVLRAAGRLERGEEVFSPEPSVAEEPLVREPMSPADVAGQEVRLASLPQIFQHIVKALNDPRSSAAYVADLVGKDVSLSAKLLRMINTPHFGLRQKVTTLSRALTFVGTDKLVSLAMGISIVTLFADMPAKLMDMSSFWRHSVACGILARLLALECGEPDEERFFVAGLLHDIGRLVVVRNRPREARAVLERGRRGKIPLHEIEQRAWGFNHAELGGRVLELWNFPLFLIQAVRLHHDPGSGGERAAAVVHVADVLAHVLAPGAGCCRVVPRLGQESWKALGLAGNAAAVLAIQADTQVEETMRVFFGAEEAG